MLHGFATASGTRRYAVRFPAALANDFYGWAAQDLQVSRLGLGTYLGEEDATTDAGYQAVAEECLRSGINFFDTALSYRDGRSERALGAAFRVLLNANAVQRDQFLICTKAGFLTPSAVPSWLRGEDTVDGIHSLHPDFLEDQLNTSRANLGLDTVDVFYLHNPEIQLAHVSRAIFEQRLQAAFERCEKLARDRRIRWYGTATWTGYREPGELDLERVIDLARFVGGEEHHLRFIQLPFNLAMTEAYQNRDGRGASVLKIANRNEIAVVASATLLQARLVNGVDAVIADRIPGFKSNSARAIQFTSSTPGVSVALVGMSKGQHLRENMEIANVGRMGTLDYEKLYRPLDA